MKPKVVQCPGCRREHEVTAPAIEVYFLDCGGFTIIYRTPQDAKRFSFMISEMARAMVEVQEMKEKLET